MDKRTKQLHELGLMNWMSIRWNLSTPQLVEQAIRRGEGHLASNGTLLITTGSRTGRSPQDRFVVEEESSKGQIAWGKINRPISTSC
jgi:phosphoenolpyruvate carboxykinase (ATP)